jgi:hypothetical protein
VKPYLKFLIVILIGIAIDETIGLFLLLLSTYVVFAKPISLQTDDFWAFCKHQGLRAGGTGVGAFVAARLYRPRPLLIAVTIGIISFLFILTTYLINVYSLGNWPTLTFARIGVMLLRVPAALLGGYLAIRFWPEKPPHQNNDEKSFLQELLESIRKFFARWSILSGSNRQKYIRDHFGPEEPPKPSDKGFTSPGEEENQEQKKQPPSDEEHPDDVI